MVMSVKVPRSLCRHAAISQAIFVSHPKYEFKSEVVDWFKALNAEYNITERIYFGKADMIVDIEAETPDDDVAVQFKLTWL
jgi:hypothetical protein